MSSFDSILSFIEGVKSVIDVSGAIQGSISDAISNGVENAFRRIRKSLEKTLIKISFMLMAVFFIVWGAALFLDNFMPYRGLGFVVVGALLGVAILVFLKGEPAA